MFRAAVMVLLAGVAAGCARISCAEDDRFNPRGDDANILLEDGISVNTGGGDACGGEITAAGGGVTNVAIRQFELILWDEPAKEAWRNQRLRVQCDPDAGVATLDTNVNDGGFLKAGTYQGQWTAVAANGNLVDCKPLFEIDVPEKLADQMPSTLILFPVVFDLHANCPSCPCQ